MALGQHSLQRHSIINLAKNPWTKAELMEQRKKVQAESSKGGPSQVEPRLARVIMKFAHMTIGKPAAEGRL